MGSTTISSRIVPLSLIFILLSMTIPLAGAVGSFEDNTISQEIPTRDYWPTDGWRYSTPEEHGMNNDTLNEMMDLIEEQDYPIHSVLVIKDGYAVFEEYPHEYYPASHIKLLHSVTKSFTGALIGIAIQQGLISGVNETVLSFFPEYTVANPDPLKDSMTIEDLLTMTAGFEWDERSLPYEYGSGNSQMEMMESPDSVQYVLDLPMLHAPGEHWVYSAGASILLGAIVQQVANQTTEEFAEEFLFEPLGFGYSSWLVVSGGWASAPSGLSLSTRDIAKLGFLYLNNGTWNGTQILPSDYVSNATEPIETRNDFGSEFDYGWHWWIREDLGIYYAWGRHGQKIMVAPEHDLVVAFTAHVPDDGYDPEFDLFRDYILQSIVTEATGPVLEIVTITGVGIFAAVVAVVWYRRK
ncbi:MAG: serine hydrolase domain-containing protein [Candidatus Thorarchaeota archaeon]